MLLSDAIEQFLSDRRVKGMSPSTVRNERTTLGQLLASVGNIQTSYLGVKQLDRFWSDHPEWQPSTYNLKRDHLSGFFQWMRTRGHLNKVADPLEGSKKRRVPAKARNLVPQTQFQELLEAARRPRDRALVALGLYLFTRVSEAMELRWRDVDFDNKTVTIYRSKTGEWDTLPMCEELEDELKRWHFEYGREAGQVPRLDWYVCPAYSAPQFEGVKGAQGRLRLVDGCVILPSKRMRNATQPIKGVLARLGYDADREGGHTLRRSGATALYHELSRVGHDRAIRMCQAMLGHKNIVTTEVYLSLDLDRKARNDLLAGKRMFDYSPGGDVVGLEVINGEADARSV